MSENENAEPLNGIEKANFWWKLKNCKLFSFIREKRRERKAIRTEFARLDREFELRKKAEHGEPYGTSCVKNAIDCYKQVYKLMYKEGHSGLSHSITVGLIKRLLDEKPLTRIEDSDFEVSKYGWMEGPDAKETFYDCKKMCGIWKYVDKQTGAVRYSMLNRIIAYDEKDGCGFSSNFVDKIVCDLGLVKPITMPFWVESQPYEVYLLDSKDGKYRYLDYMIDSDGKYVKINKLYDYGSYDLISDITEITDRTEKARIVTKMRKEAKKE